jgi:superfamily II RNA helicase
VVFNFQLDDFQIEATQHITNGKSVVLCAPTGAGKTVLAEHAIHLAIESNKKVFYTTPLKALSNQKFNDFGAKYGFDKVGLLTGDTSINRGAQVTIMTTEVFRNMLYGTNFGKVEENMRDVQYVVLDEVHYMNDDQRGTVWEESIIHCPNNIQLIALSATIANSQALTDWINSVHGKTELVFTDFRPVPLRHYFYSPSNPTALYSLFTPDGKLNGKIERECETKGKNQKFTKKKTAKLSVPQLVRVLNRQNMLPAIYFAFSRKKCDMYMETCSELNLLNEFEKQRLVQIIDEYIVDNPFLAKNKHLEYLYAGVAAHHAGLLPAWKGLVEKLFQQGLIKVVFATETLAAGINMPARTTIISSISKRSDEGHRTLNANEFLQMSGRAGRRGMDDVGNVVTIASPFESPEEIAQLASSKSNPLESRFAPSYSMVLNLLQRFSLEESRELILKSFGYYSSTERLRPLYLQKQEFEGIINRITQYSCPYGLDTEALLKYNKYKNMYIEHRNITKTLKKQARNTGRHNSSEVQEFEVKTKEYFNQMYEIPCNDCKRYRVHIKDIEVLARFQSKLGKLEKTIEYQKDVYWRQFLNHAAILEETGYLQDNYPTENGLMTSAVRSENELYFTEVILSGLLTDLEPAELAGVLCAIVTEDVRKDCWVKFQLSKVARKTIDDIYQIVRRLNKIQKQYGVEAPLNLNPFYSPIIEHWVNGGDWDEMMATLDLGEGDLIRIFKRTVDLLRQLTVIPNVPEKLVKTAGLTIDCINREPVTDIF